MHTILSALEVGHEVGIEVGHKDGHEQSSSGSHCPLRHSQWPLVPAHSNPIDRLLQPVEELSDPVQVLRLDTFLLTQRHLQMLLFIFYHH